MARGGKYQHSVENNIQSVSESTGAKFSCVTVVQFRILHIRYRCTLLDHYDLMHYPDLSFEENRPIIARQE